MCKFCPGFYPNILRWNKNPELVVRNYSDLDKLPILVVVVEKGKVGVTYPRSLRYYDLRMRYKKNSTAVRAPVEQDTGRGCR